MHEKLIVTEWSPCQLYRCSFPAEQYYCKQQLCSEPLSFLGETLQLETFSIREGITVLGKRFHCCLVGNRALALLKAPAADRFLQNLYLQENVRKLSLVRKSLKMLSFSLGSSLRLCSLHLSFHSGCWRRLQDIGHEPKPAELPRFPFKYNYYYSLMPNLWSHCSSALSVTEATLWLQLTQAKFWK